MLSKKHYESALSAQTACNLRAVSAAFESATKEMASLGMNTDEIRNHPVSRLFVEQMSHLTKRKNYLEAYFECQRASEGKDSAVAFGT